MSKLDQIKDTEIKVFLKNVHFDFDISKDNPLGAHIHYTTGAASLMDEAFLFKSKDGELSKEETEILKSLESKKEEIMDEKVQKELEAENADLKAKLDEIQKQLKTDRVEKSLIDLTLGDEILGDVVKTLVSMSDEDQAVIVKAFTAVKDLKVVKEAVVEENTLQKELASEAGVDGDGEIVEKSLIEKITIARKELEGEK